jgi:hypothetical protein
LRDGCQETLDQVIGIDLVSAGVEVKYEPVAKHWGSQRLEVREIHMESTRQ